jgi:hypothetical protein
MLREQQKSSKALHSNALFKEFRDEGKHFKKFGKGYAVAQQEAAQPMIDDFQAEGNSRMFQLIKSTAEREEKPLQGVWASFGKPYISQGPPDEVNHSACIAAHTPLILIVNEGTLHFVI